jgi:Zn-dependent protease
MPVLELVLPDRSRVPLLGEMTIGRAPSSTVRLEDPAISRRHARITVERNGSGRIVLEDTGSSYGTWLDGRRVDGPSPLGDGSRIRMGNQELLVERLRGEDEAGRTIVVEAAPAADRFGANPRVRTGYALKRLEASEGARRWVLRELESRRFLRMSDEDATLFQLLDGEHPLVELVRESERRYGPEGPVRLARLLSELAERGLLTGVEGAETAPPPTGLMSRLATPRDITWSGAGALFERLYRQGGRRLFTRPALMVIAALTLIGLVVFPYLVVARYGTPFVVAQKIGLGGLVFLLGRFAVVAVHETAHGLTMANYGRRVRKAGLKLIMIFPYAYVDTSEAWFEPRRRRVAISAAGPVSDFSLGALFAICCLALPAGTARDIFFQLAFAAYLGGFFNLNPVVDRDGYQILVDLLREPGLRPRAREQLARRLRGQGQPTDSPVLARYAALGLAWSALAACFGTAMSLRYEPRMAEVAPEPIVWAALAGVWIAFFLPVVLVLGGPVRERMRSREA